MPLERAAVRSWVRPGVARENHSGAPSGRSRRRGARRWPGIPRNPLRAVKTSRSSAGAPGREVPGRSSRACANVCCGFDDARAAASDMLDELMGDVEQGGHGTNRAPSVAGAMSGITTPTTRGPASSPHPLTSPFHPPAQDERGSLTTGTALTRRPYMTRTISLKRASRPTATAGAVITSLTMCGTARYMSSSPRRVPEQVGSATASSITASAPTADRPVTDQSGPVARVPSLAGVEAAR